MELVNESVTSMSQRLPAERSGLCHMDLSDLGRVR